MKTCAYEEVHCTNSECNEVMTRRNLQYHLVSKCRWRVVSCHFCADMYTYKDSKVSCKYWPGVAKFHGKAVRTVA